MQSTPVSPKKCPESHMKRPSFLSRMRMSSQKGRDYKSKPEEAFDALIEILASYQAIESKVGSSPTTPSKKPSSDKKRLRRSTSLINEFISQTNETGIEGPSLHSASMTFVYYLLNMTLDEFYTNYLDYYKQFDSNCDFQIQQHEFYGLLDYIAAPNHIDKAKVLRSFKIYSPEKFQRVHNIAVLNPSTDDHLEQVIKQGMFMMLLARRSDTHPEALKGGSISYPKFFPLVVSYFAEFIRQKVEARVHNMASISGLDNKQVASAFHGTSLLSKIESLGYTYNGDQNPTKISVKVLERALILFRNSYTGTFQQEQLEMVIKELKAKFRVSDVSSMSSKLVKLNSKLLEWLAFRVCLHSSLYNISQAGNNRKKVPRTKVLDEYTTWAGARGAKKFNRDIMRVRFKKYAAKRRPEDASVASISSAESKEELRNLLKGFARKLLPHISDKSVDRMFTTFCEDNKHFADGTDMLFQMSEQIFTLFIKEANIKLRDFVSTVCKNFPDSTNKTLSDGRDNRKEIVADNSPKKQKDKNATKAESQKSLENMLTIICNPEFEDNDKNNVNITNESLNFTSGIFTQGNIQRPETKRHSSLLISRGSLFHLDDPILNKNSEKSQEEYMREVKEERRKRRDKEEEDAVSALNLTGNEIKREPSFPRFVRSASARDASEDEASSASRDSRKSSFSMEKLNMLIEPSISRQNLRFQIPNTPIETNSATLLNEDASKSVTKPRKGSVFSGNESFQFVRPTAPKIDLSLATGDPNSAVSITRRRHSEMDLTKKDLIHNTHTGRKTDVLKSCLIIESFLEKLSETTSLSPTGRSKSARNYSSGYHNQNDFPDITPSQRDSSSETPKSISRNNTPSSFAYKKSAFATERPIERVSRKKTRANTLMLRVEDTKTFYTMENLVIEEYLQDYDLLESERLHFKKNRDIDPGKKREKGLCCSSRCSVF